jgi:hypothetical protein
MPKKLLYTWTVSKARVTHERYGVCKLCGRIASPAEVVAGPYESAAKAVAAAERLGDCYTAFRLVKSKSGTQPRERIEREDLPVDTVLTTTGPASRKKTRQQAPVNRKER